MSVFGQIPPHAPALAGTAGGGSDATLSRAQWRMLLLAGFGGALEFYDFVVFGVFAATIGAAFFPAGDTLVSQLAGYAGFGLGYLARPLGGIVMAHLGDRGGRRRVFVGSVLAMSLSTVGLGLLPTYAQIGAAAPVLLLSLRLIQGFCVGGELPGAVTYVVETAPRHASFACGVVFTCVNTGVLLATLVSLLVNSLLPEADVAAWGWRIGFLLGGLLGLAGFPLRRTLAETPAFSALRSRVLRLPLARVVGAYPMQVAIGIATSAVTASFNGLLFVLLPGYLTRVLHYPAPSAAAAQAVGVVAYTAGLLAVAWLGDRVPRRRLMGGGALLVLAGVWPWFAAAAAHSVPLVPLVAVAGLAASVCTGVFAVVLADLFPARVRYSGVALPYNISFTAFSGTFPLLATYAIAATGWLTAPALVMAACAALTLLGSLGLRRWGVASTAD